MITLGYITSRRLPHLDWLFDSLRQQDRLDAIRQIVIVDFYAQVCDGRTTSDWLARQHEVMSAARDLQHLVTWTPPKPTVWAGPHRLTKENWWHAANARNTWLCLATQPWCAGLDDRCVLEPNWITTILEAVAGEYAVFGSYEKHHGMQVVDGRIRDVGKTDSVDHREKLCRDNGTVMPFRCPPEWSYGCNGAFRTDWLLESNGWDERCDGAGFEDSHLGPMLKENGRKLRYDYRLKVIQDRTPSECADSMLKRDKGVSPRDKSHAIVDMMRGLKRSGHQWDLNAVRQQVLNGGAWPIPTGPDRDWYDNELLSQMTLHG